MNEWNQIFVISASKRVQCEDFSWVRTKIDGKGWDCFPSDGAQSSRAVSTGRPHDDLYQQIAPAKCLLGQIQLFSKEAEYLVKFPCLPGLFWACKPPIEGSQNALLNLSKMNFPSEKINASALQARTLKWICLKETLRLLNEPYRSQSNAINTWFRKVLIAMHISRDLTVSATSLRTKHLHSFG